MEQAELKVIRYNENDVISTSFGGFEVSFNPVGEVLKSFSISALPDGKEAQVISDGTVNFATYTYTIKQDKDGYFWVEGGRYKTNERIDTPDEAMDLWTDFRGKRYLNGSNNYIIQ